VGRHGFPADTRGVEIHPRSKALDDLFDWWWLSVGLHGFLLLLGKTSRKKAKNTLSMQNFSCTGF
jgi:hypothetical protein